MYTYTYIPSPANTLADLKQEQILEWFVQTCFALKHVHERKASFTMQLGLPCLGFVVAVFRVFLVHIQIYGAWARRLSTVQNRVACGIFERFVAHGVVDPWDCQCHRCRD